LNRLVRAIALVDARFEHVSIAHPRLDRAGPVVATSLLADTMAAAQLSCEQGGIAEALRTGLPVIVTAADRATRFPRMHPVAGNLGVQLQLVVPLVHRTLPVGALSVYTTDDTTVDLSLLELAEALALQAVVVLEQEQMVGDLEVAVSTRQRIGQACGILMSRFVLSDEDAFAALRHVSQHRNVKVRDLSLEVIATGTLAELEGHH
jgi:GAF domain-containing protein